MRRLFLLALALTVWASPASTGLAEETYPREFHEFFKAGTNVSVRGGDNMDGFSVRIYSDEVFPIAQDYLKNKPSFDKLREKYPAIEKAAQKFLEQNPSKKEAAVDTAEPAKRALGLVTPLVTGRLGTVTHRGTDYVVIQYEDTFFGELSVIPLRSITRLQLPSQHELNVRELPSGLIDESK